VSVEAASFDAAAGHLERREEARRPVALSGRIGCVRFSAWIGDFSSTQRTIARSGGFRYRPTMSTLFRSKSGSVLNWNVSTRWG
jgi:hypothetical protein